MTNDIFDEPEVKSIDDYLGSLKDSLREELSKDIVFSVQSQTVKSGYIRLRRKDLSEIILIHDNHGTIIWNAMPIKYRLQSSHIAAGIYKVWLEASVSERVYQEGKGIPRCRFNLAYHGECSAFAEKGHKFCATHLKEKCSCGKQAVGECSFAGQFVCGRPLCENCKCKH